MDCYKSETYNSLKYRQFFIVIGSSMLFTKFEQGRKREREKEIKQAEIGKALLCSNKCIFFKGILAWSEET